ncbi:DUF6036 family nucleotidyltransferase [Gemmatimonas sp.]|uniref:DUF6036 family nucleotidyltransferase n=1 Tax=Gemmatimonas sp. TaxID=1962908 RepID=UPI0025C729EC|nr:DUF6036 family nucleotidyltransferase [Gemmatimonas sp.]MCA2992888.1 hypothetical protein [Gemmatimonas sp.]
MMREQFEHAIRAAGAVLGVTELLVIGSQAVHGSMTGPLPIEAARSVEVDVAVRGDVEGRLADLIDGSIGEASMFHDTFGYDAQGVVESTARLPDGWQARLVPFDTPGTRGVTAWCLELHDLWVSKAVAGREKDREFCRALVQRGVVMPDVLTERLDSVLALDPRVRSTVLAWITA